jgi:hypothetical protein
MIRTFFIRIIPFNITIFWLFSCSSPEKKPDVPQIVIDIDKSEPLLLSKLFDEVAYVPLSDSFLIGEIDGAKVYGDRLLLHTGNQIFMYDAQTGAPLLKIDQLGKGPGEYDGISDILLDETENHIEVLSRQKVLRYDMKGNFVNNFSTPFRSFTFYKTNSGDYLFYGGNMNFGVAEHEYMLMRYRPETDSITGRHFPIDEHLAGYFHIFGYQNFSSRPLIFHYAPSDTVYGFADSGAPVPRYTVNFASHHVPESFYREAYSDIADFSNKATERSYIYGFHCAENRSALAFSFRNGGVFYWAIHDKKNGATHIANTWTDDRRFDGKITIGYENWPIMADDEHLYFFLQPTQLKELAEGSGLREPTSKSNSNRLADLYHSPGFSEESNPILVICKFKK